jgi:hypothetical protein
MRETPALSSWISGLNEYHQRFRSLYCASWLILLMVCTSNAYSQSPDRIPYQSVIRNSTGALLAEKAVGLRISILRGSATGTVIFSETHRDTTNAYGMAQVDIGAGTVVSGTMAGIDWSQGPFYIRVETDPAGGTNYQIVGTTQLLSVPFSLFTKSAPLRYSSSGDTLFSGSQYVIVPGLSSANANAVVSGSPNVTTSVVTSVTTISASLGGEVLSAGATPVTARGICYGTSASPTVSNNTVASGSGTGVFTTSLPGLSPATTYYARAYAVNASGTSYGNQVTFRTESAAGQACAQGSTMTVTHTAGDVAPVTKTVTYKIVQTDLSGVSKCWLAQNLGADRQALSSADFSEESAGWYWQFNRKQGYKHDGMIRTPNTSWPIINENSNWTSANDPCTLLLGSTWRLPTLTEWDIAAATAYRNTNGNSFASEFVIHKSGIIDENGQIFMRGVTAFFQIKNQTANETSYKGTDAGIMNWNFTSKRIAAAVRCVKD